MEDKRTEEEKCNGWLRKMGAFILYIYGDGAEYYEDYEYEDSMKYVKDNYAPLVSQYLKSLESNDIEQKKDTILSIIHYFDEFFSRIKIICRIITMRFANAKKEILSGPIR